MKRLFSAITGAVVRLGFSVLLLWLRVLYRPRVRFEGKRGKELFRSPAVIISNHKTHKDGGLLPLALGRRHIVTFVAKDWYEDPKYHRYLRHLPYLPLDRKEWDTAWLDEGLRALADGKAVLIFPQGRTEKEGTTIPFHPGFALLAQRGGVPVIPVALPDLRKGRRNIIRVGEPFTVIAKEGERVSRVCRVAAAEAEENIRRLAGDEEPRGTDMRS